MQLDLSGKVALITGSSRGIGFAIASALHAEGCRVILNARHSKSLLLALEKIPGAQGIQGNVSDAVDAKRIVLEASCIYNQLDIVVCNVGSGSSVPPGEETPQEWERVFALNLWSTTNVVEAARNRLAQSKGVIVCISSICGSEVIAGAPITYSAAKAALNAYIRGIARPLGLQGIRINGISPGNILFDGSIWARKISEDAELVKITLKKNVPLERLGTPEEIANMVVYLASSATSFSTGAIWRIDGGQSHS